MYSNDLDHLNQLRRDAWFAARDREARAKMGPVAAWLHERRHLIARALLWALMLPIMFVLPAFLAFVIVVMVLGALTAGQHGRLPGSAYGP
jgi:hypothetical protein